MHKNPYRQCTYILQYATNTGVGSRNARRRWCWTTLGNENKKTVKRNRYEKIELIRYDNNGHHTLISCERIRRKSINRRDHFPTAQHWTRINDAFCSTYLLGLYLFSCHFFCFWFLFILSLAPFFCCCCLSSVFGLVWWWTIKRENWYWAPTETHRNVQWEFLTKCKRNHQGFFFFFIAALFELCVSYSHRHTWDTFWCNAMTSVLMVRWCVQCSLQSIRERKFRPLILSIGIILPSSPTLNIQNGTIYVHFLFLSIIYGNGIQTCVMRTLNCSLLS